MIHYKFADWWIGRWAKVQPEALEAVECKTAAVVVTGGSRGIGFAIAERFAHFGQTVVIVARDADRLHKARETLSKLSNAEIIAVSLDITRDDAPDALDRELARCELYVDVIVNNAGVGASGGFTSRSFEELEHLLALNMTALTRLMRHYLPDMISRGRGGIINIASLGGAVPGPYQAAYYASQAYVLSLSEAVASENAGRGVRICALAPGPVTTTFHAQMDADNSLYRWFLPALTPQAVARSTYRGYRLGHRVIVPGVTNVLVYLAVRFLPHRITVPIVGWLLHPRRR